MRKFLKGSICNFLDTTDEVFFIASVVNELENTSCKETTNDMSVSI